MRRQARISAGGALVVRSPSALQVWLWLLIFIFQNEFRISRSIQPGYLDFDNLPETNFTCSGKVIGGYYADLETSCQMFHVCTVGQQDEPMDIKFLCLNGTVFDQETRVCERVDEVDCTKSEKFYSLNLELYGSSTAPPVIEADQPKPQAPPTEQSVQQAKPSHNEPDPNLNEPSTTVHGKTQDHSTDTIDSTEDPIQDIKKDEHKIHLDAPATRPSLTFPDHDEITGEYEEDEIDSENPEYEEDYSNFPTTTTVQAPTSTTTTTTTTTTTRRPLTTAVSPSQIPPHHLSPIPHFNSSPIPISSSLSTPAQSSSVPSAPSLPTLDPALLSPQEFIYRHRGPGTGAISFQRQSFRPADGVYITHAPPQQYDHFQYESSRTAPRPAQPRPVPFVQRPQPAPFRPTTLDPRDQLLRPGPTSQPSERHEMTVKHRPQSYPSVLPAQRPLPFNPYYYDRKRSDDTAQENESSLAARSVAPPTVTERPPTKPKSPPRVIVTASASVSDSNGKRLNYTVGNVVSAVKPIVPINYDDYKESDLIFDPFFLDVPKLQKRRKTRSSRNQRIFTVPSTATISSDTGTIKVITSSPVTSRVTPTIPSGIGTVKVITSSPITSRETATISSNIGIVKVTTSSPVTSRATTTERPKTTGPTTTTTVAWNPNDYVDDNYEPHAYIPPGPPLAVLVAQDHNNNKQERKSKNVLTEDKTLRDHKANILEHSRPTSSAVQIISSQIEGVRAAHTVASPPMPPPFGAHSCATLHSTDCRTRA